MTCLTSKIIISIFSFVFLSFILTAPTSAQTQGAAASLLFSPETISAQAGEQFTSQVWIDTDGAPAGGVDTKITFDPAVVEVEKIETLPIFPDYPATTFDNVAGTALISGIVNSQDQLYTGKGQFATISWKAKAAGNGNVAITFEPNSTSDSNIAVLYGNGDILQKVNTLSVTVSGDGSSSSMANTADNNSYNTKTGTGKYLSPFEIGLGLLTLFSIVFQFNLYRKIQQIEQYKEGVPHIKTPSPLN